MAKQNNSKDDKFTLRNAVDVSSDWNGVGVPLFLYSSFPMHLNKNYRPYLVAQSDKLELYFSGSLAESASAPPPPDPIYPVIYYDVEKSLNTMTDTSLSGSNIVMNVYSDWSRDIPWGSVYQSLNMDGSNEYVDVPEHDDLEFTGSNFSISMWIKRNAVNTQHSMLEKFDYVNPTDNGGWSMRIRGDNKLQWTPLDDDDGAQALVGGTNIPQSSWQHVIGVASGSIWKIYLNGSHDGEKNITVNPKASVGTMKIGARGVDAGTPFNGKITQVALWDTPLDSGSISSLYNSGNGEPASTISPSNLVAYYDMSDGIDTTVTDVQGSHPGTTQNMEVTSFEDNTFVSGTKALAMDGSTVYGHVVAGSEIVNFEHNIPFSVSAWFKTAASDTSYIVSKMESAEPYRGWRMGLQGGDLVFHLVNDWSDNQRIGVRDSVGSRNNNAWHHLVATYNGSGSASDVALYVDGAVIGTTTEYDTLASNTIVTGSTQLSIGALNGDSPFKSGSVDEVSIWDFELSSYQVSQLYNSGSGIDANVVFN